MDTRVYGSSEREEEKNRQQGWIEVVHQIPSAGGSFSASERPMGHDAIVPGNSR